MRTGQISEMKELQAGVEGDISLTPDPEGLVNRFFVLLRQGQEALARHPGRALRPDGAGLGRDVGPVLLGPH